MNRDYPRLTVEEFGKVLLESNDLDPVYVALYSMLGNGVVDQDQLNRWVLAYILCYHCGAACWLSEHSGKEFFRHVYRAAYNADDSPVGGRWPRSHERRHWRGQFAVDVTRKLQERYQDRPEDFLYNIAFGGVATTILKKPEPVAFKTIVERVKQHHGFGDWASFKLADIIDRIGLVPVRFDFDDVTIYKDPVLAAETLFRQRNGYPDHVGVKREAVKQVFNYLSQYFEDFAAPPLYDRPISVQEIETVLCKWKSHNNGRYPIYNDLTEIRHGLVPWFKIGCETATEFFNRTPPIPVEAVSY